MLAKLIAAIAVVMFLVSNAIGAPTPQQMVYMVHTSTKQSVPVRQVQPIKKLDDYTVINEYARLAGK